MIQGVILKYLGQHSSFSVKSEVLKKFKFRFFLFICGEPKSKHALIQKRSEIKLKEQVFLTAGKERHQNLKRTEIIPYMKGVVPSPTPRSLL